MAQEIQKLNNLPKKDKKGTTPGLTGMVKWLIILLLLSVLLIISTSPLRGHAAKRLIKKGDNFLAENKYVSAALLYDKAAALSGKDSVSGKKALLSRASTDILKLEEFYKDRGNKEKIEKIEKVSGVPANEVEAVKLSRAMIEEGEYQLAIVSAKTATEMDPEYKDAWVYLAIANKKTAENVELLPETRKQYLEGSERALEKAKGFDPSVNI